MIKYCEVCGSRLKKRLLFKEFSMENGKLNYEHYDLRCPKWWALHNLLHVRSYEEIKVK